MVKGGKRHTRPYPTHLLLVWMIAFALGGLVRSAAAALEGPLAASTSVLKAEMDAYIETNYLDRLAAEPDNDALRTKLLRVYLGLHQFDTAIRTAQDYLLDKQGDRARTYNELGIAYSLKNEQQLAALNFQLALELRPDDEGIKKNLVQAMEARGRSTVQSPKPRAETELSGNAKSSAAILEADSFYWIE